MKTFNDLKQINNMEETIVALGNFDGLHKGHQELIEKTLNNASERNLKTAVFSFSNHPLNLLKEEKAVKNISYLKEKEVLLDEMGVDYFFNIEFNEDIMKMSPESFIRDIIIDKFNAKGVVCGFNYRFGYKAEGDLELLKKLGEKEGFTVDVIEPVIINGEVVSSTLIRGLIKSGEIMDVKDFLGRNYSIEGKVVVGNKIGRTIGFPTSNLTINDTIITPPNGVYVTNCIYKDEVYPSITNVGTRPTIGSFEKNIETHIFNFNKELYGKTIRIEFLSKIRDEVKFHNVDELKEQIKKDCEKTKSWHEDNKINIFEIVS